jgi:hypothetical protein
MTPVNDRPSMPVGASNLELLRRFEPIVRFTKGERFFPTDVERYVRSCSLWAHTPDGSDELLVPEGELTLGKLTQPRPAELGTVSFLKFIGSLSVLESAQVLSSQARVRRDKEDVFHTGMGRLARGGYLPRIADALFSATLLLRGTVPGATAAAAAIAYSQMQQLEEKYVYHGRIVREEGWTVVQYWFFYCYNNWRSGFHGVNDHESDWEMVLVYLYEQQGMLVPEWAAYASHDFHGDDLRRRWDDREELELVDGHPVVYAGAGSHASYFRQGEYQASPTLPLPGWLTRVSRALNVFWTETLGQAGRQGGLEFQIPFVDYARGDGLSIGPGQENGWTPVVIDEETPWVSQYRGLWGLFARDPISGENAPAGPMYNRDGSPRDSWYDPLGFSGLDKVPPPPEETRLVEQRCGEIQERQAQLENQVVEKGNKLHKMGAELKAIERDPHLAKQYEGLKRSLDEMASQLKTLRREQSQNSIMLNSLQDRLERLEAGDKDSPRAHIRHLAAPVAIGQMRFNRLIEAWAAVSIGLLLLGFVALIVFTPHYMLLGAVVLIVGFSLLESIFRGTFSNTVGSLAVWLALLATIVLVLNFWFQIIVGGLIAGGVVLLWQKVRELRG